MADSNQKFAKFQINKEAVFEPGYGKDKICPD
jgi:hypothetical protein